jgi:hypothetical protein
MKIIASSTAMLCVTIALSASATTPYQATLSDSACKNLKACTLKFPVVAAGETLTVTHVSCSIVSFGELGGVYGIVLSTAKTAEPALGDFIPATAYLNGKNLQYTPNIQTLFYVSAGDQPTISIASTTDIIGNASGGCFLSGATTP